MRLAALWIAIGLVPFTAPSMAVAQTPRLDLDLEIAAEQRTVDDETIAAITLYATGGAALVAGAVMLPIGIFDLNGICSGTCDGGGTLFIGGVVTLGISAIALLVAIGLSIDAAIRGGRLETRRHAVSFDGALTFHLDG